MLPSSLQKFITFLSRIGSDLNDDDEVRLQKTLLVFSSLMMATLAIIWGSIYLLFGEYIAASIPISYTILSYLSLASFARTGRYRFYRFSQLLLPLLLPFFLMIALGGFVNSSGVVLWSLTSPFGAMLFAGRRQAIRWFIAFIALIFIGAALEPYGRTNTNLSPAMMTIFFVMNIGCTSIVAFLLIQHFVSQRNASLRLLNLEQEKVKKAYSLLSKYVAPQLADKISDGQIDSIWKHNRKKLTLFFSDIKDFTSITDTLEPEDMADVLNEYLTEMNKIINEYRGTLAQVIGDGLYVFFGAPDSKNDVDNALRCVNMAIYMQRKMTDLNKKWFDMGIDELLQIRCGINTGMATVGGYGSSERKEYTAMGMQTNIAARIEQACEPGGILISHTTWALIKNEIPCTENKQIQIKGYPKPVRTYAVNL